MKRKRVLMVASVASMIDQFNRENLVLLQELGYEVHVACNFREGNTCDEKRVLKLRADLRNMHIILHQWDCPRSVRNPVTCVRAYIQIKQLLARYHFDWLHCHSPVGGALARTAAYRKNVRVIYTAHGFHFYKGAPLKNWLLYYSAEKLLAYQTDVLITVNQEDYRLAERKLCAGSIHRIPGVGIATFRYGKLFADAPAEADVMECDAKACAKKAVYQKYNIPKGAKLVLSVGELNKGKNHRMVLDALARLPDRDIYYLICGQGALREELWHYALKTGVAGRIRMPGFQEDLSVVYQSADVFVFPSLREGMPVALLEAMAAGTACAVSDIRGNAELIAEKYRFPPDRPDLLVQILGRLLNDERERNRQIRQNLEKVKKYSNQAVSRQMKRIYQQMNHI
ncbi:MAG: glycosyltransferase [Eubacterium sp.]|nr:glycosyltransferase [Eubacterium sp.]